MTDMPLQPQKHTVSIEYCVPCDYSQQAIAVVEGLVRDYQHLIDRLELVMGSKGTFDVTVDDTLIFSKAEQKRFPEAGEILTLFEGVLGHIVEKYPRD